MHDDAPIPRSAPTWPRFLWHHRVHRHHGEELFFVRLGFQPLYERDTVEAGIRAACVALGIRSYIAYELLGPYDSLLRAWLPRECTADAFIERLKDELIKPAGLKMADAFEVDYVARHWLFLDGDGPSESALHNLQEIEIEEVDKNFPDISETLRERLRRHHLLAPFGGWDRSLDPDSPGIKFMVVVGSDPDRPLEPGELVSFEEVLMGVLERASHIKHRSLYKGEGMGHFLIMGRVEYDKFHNIHAEIITQINAAAIRDRYRARTSTHISGQRGYHIAEEALTRSPTPAVAAAAPERVTSTLEPGEVFDGRFKVVVALGGGGFAKVYKVFDRFERVDRALKVFNSSDPRFARREIDALRRAREHPNIVKLFLDGQSGDRWYLVCEFVDGQPLNRLDGLDDINVLGIMLQVLDALAAVHPNDERIDELRARRTLTELEMREYQELLESGLIHRDIKPENIMVDTEGVVRLVDFNIASPARDKRTTRSGTPPYQAPDAGLEYWEPSDDVFACGVVLYELLCDGRHPWENSQPVADVAPTDPRTWRPDLSPELSAIVVRACAPMRSDRYATAQELRGDLERELHALAQRDAIDETPAQRLGRIVRERRTQRGLSQQQLSSAIGIPVEKIAEIEAGRASPSKSDALKIAERLELELRQLFGGSEPP